MTAVFLIDLRHPRAPSSRPESGGGRISPAIYVLGLTSFLAWLIVALWIGALLQLEFTALWLGAVGLVYGVVSLLRPSWYWTSPPITRFRRRLGDRGARGVSLIVCSALIAAAAFREVRLASAHDECNRLLAASPAGATRTTSYNHRQAIGVTDYFTGKGMTCLELRARGR